jgi:hypothetical protein
MSDDEPIEEATSELWWEHLATFVSFTGAAILAGLFLLVGGSKLTPWVLLCCVAAVVFCPIMALIAFRAMWNNWTVEQTDAAYRALTFLFLTPLVLVGIVLLGIWLYSFWGWLGTIPSWEYITIILLILIRGEDSIMRANTTSLIITSEMQSALQECYDVCATRLGRPPQDMTEMLDMLEGLAPGTPADTQDLKDTIQHLRQFQNHSKMPQVFGELRDSSRIRD